MSFIYDYIITRKTFDKRVLKNGGRVGDIFSGHFLDLNSDCMPELVVFGQGDGSVGGQRRLDVWGRQVRFGRTQVEV